MIDSTKAAYSSNLYYPEIIHNEQYVLSRNQTISIPYEVDYIPYIRMWVELFPGEFGQPFISSPQYQFMPAYSIQNIYGYVIEVESNNLSIYSDCPSPRTVYVRMYARE